MLFLLQAPFSLVVRASPSHPPFSLLCVMNQLRKKHPDGHVIVSSHVHSSLKQNVSKGLLADFASETGRAGSGLKFRLSVIWKEGEKEIL